ncbi:unnamed protein product [Effrenium voratum]|nr:unnamed protein product [Effrenium voratum]
MTLSHARRAPRPGVEDEDSLAPDVQSSILSALLQDPPPALGRKESRSPNRSAGRPPLAAAGAAALREGRRPRSGDESLLASMASRLAQVEQQNKQLMTRLKQQNQEMEDLREQLAARSAEGASGDEAPLQAECARLRSQVEEMKQFMAEYGLSWRGRKTESSGVSVNFQVIQSRVEALNAALEQESCKVVPEGGYGARLSNPAEKQLPLTFFGDGLKLAHHGFMPFATTKAQEIIRELLDGYLPRVLREEFPDGVSLKAVDRTSLSFQQWLKEPHDPELAEGGERLRAIQALHDPKDARSAAERFVSKLPERVLRNGQVCQVRSAIAQRLGVESSARSASAPPDRGGEVSLLALGRPVDAPTARLQVKLEGGQKVLLSMEFNSTVGELWQALAEWRSKNKVPRARPGCVLRTAFPPKSYSDKSQTLQEAGLTPSATLFVSCEASQDQA